MPTPEPPSSDDVAKALARLFVDMTETPDPAVLAEELQAYDVDVRRLSDRLKAIVSKAEESDKLAWLDDYRARQTTAPRELPTRPQHPRTREEKLRRISKLSPAVGFRNLGSLSDADLDRILTVLEEPDVNPG